MAHWFTTRSRVICWVLLCMLFMQGPAVSLAIQSLRDTSTQRFELSVCGKGSLPAMAIDLGAAADDPPAADGVNSPCLFCRLGHAVPLVLAIVLALFVASNTAVPFPDYGTAVVFSDPGWLHEPVRGPPACAQLKYLSTP